MESASVKHKVLTQGHFYRVWAMESEKGPQFIRCQWCNKEFLASNITGKNGHEQTKAHRQKQNEFEARQQKSLNQNPLVLMTDRLNSTKLFSYRFTQICLGNKSEILCLYMHDFFRNEYELFANGKVIRVLIRASS